VSTSTSPTVAEDRTGTQFVLGTARQLTLDGRSEPVSEPCGRSKIPDFSDPPEAAAKPLTDDELFDPRQQSFTWRESRALVGRLTDYAATLDKWPSSQKRADLAVRQLKWCGLNARDDVELRRVERDDGRTSHHVAGTFHCGKPLCPSCASFVSRRRSEALADTAPHVAAAHPNARSFHCVLTVRHRPGVRLDALRACFAGAWEKLRHVREWRRGVVGFVRVTELTYSVRGGFHLHIHCLLTVREGADPEALRLAIRAAWSRLVGEDRTVKSKNKATGELTTRVVPGRSVDFEAQERSAAANGRRGWWSEITGGPHDTLEYLVSKVLREEVTAGGAKGGSRLWDLPPPQYFEAWYSMKGYRWFSTGGCWRVRPELEDDDAADELRETTGAVVGVCPQKDWQSVDYPMRAWMCGLVGSRTVDAVSLSRAWRTFLLYARQCRDEKDARVGDRPRYKPITTAIELDTARPVG
jgi:Replication protein